MSVWLPALLLSLTPLLGAIHLEMIQEMCPLLEYIIVRKVRIVAQGALTMGHFSRSTLDYST